MSSNMRAGLTCRYDDHQASATDPRSQPSRAYQGAPSATLPQLGGRRQRRWPRRSVTSGHIDPRSRTPVGGAHGPARPPPASSRAATAESPRGCRRSPWRRGTLRREDSAGDPSKARARSARPGNDERPDHLLQLRLKVRAEPFEEALVQRDASTGESRARLRGDAAPRSVRPRCSRRPPGLRRRATRASTRRTPARAGRDSTPESPARARSPRGGRAPAAAAGR